jgi:hypothetical protein
LWVSFPNCTYLTLFTCLADNWNRLGSLLYFLIPAMYQIPSRLFGHMYKIP